MISAGELVWLDVDGTYITDDGLESLSRMQFLRVLKLANTGVTADGLSRLHAKMPNVCVIDLEPETASPRLRLMDALCRGELFGKLSDSLWNDLKQCGGWMDAPFDNQVIVGVADKAEEGHVVINLVVNPLTHFVTTFVTYVPCW